MRVVELPLGATEDRVVGTLDVEHAIKHGEKRFEPGILADANRNFLYVDEVNLLEDHIVDLLLDAAAMGVNYVEREGVSFVHPARFILVGTMNPEEGELRPQLLDRFGLSVQIQSIKDKALRAEILRRREEFDLDPEGSSKQWEREQVELSKRITEAKSRLSAIKVPYEILQRIVTLTSQLNVDGHRADIVILKAARALSAFREKEEVEIEEIRDAARLGLGHRLKRSPFEEIKAEREKMEELLSSL
jgi:magnesium chelatase subunit I